MKKIFILLFIFYGTASFAQKMDKEIDSMRRNIAKQNASLESLNRRTDSMLLERSKHDDSITRSEDMERNSRNLNALVSTMREREKKERRNMWLRIGLGISFLVIGIIGVTRKRKSKNNTTA
jgi:hypothetical protein